MHQFDSLHHSRITRSRDFVMHCTEQQCCSCLNSYQLAYKDHQDFQQSRRHHNSCPVDTDTNCWGTVVELGNHIRKSTCMTRCNLDEAHILHWLTRYYRCKSDLVDIDIYLVTTTSIVFSFALLELTVNTSVRICIIRTDQTLTNRTRIITPTVLIWTTVLIHCSPVFTTTGFWIAIPKHRWITRTEIRNTNQESTVIAIRIDITIVAKHVLTNALEHRGMSIAKSIIRIYSVTYTVSCPTHSRFTLTLKFYRSTTVIRRKRSAFCSFYLVIGCLHALLESHIFFTWVLHWDIPDLPSCHTSYHCYKSDWAFAFVHRFCTIHSRNANRHIHTGSYYRANRDLDGSPSSLYTHHRSSLSSTWLSPQR